MTSSSGTQLRDKKPSKPYAVAMKDGRPLGLGDFGKIGQERACCESDRSWPQRMIDEVDHTDDLVAHGPAEAVATPVKTMLTSGGARRVHALTEHQRQKSITALRFPIGATAQSNILSRSAHSGRSGECSDGRRVGVGATSPTSKATLSATSLPWRSRPMAGSCRRRLRGVWRTSES